MSDKKHTVKPRDLHRLNAVRGREIERVANADKTFPDPSDPDLETTDVPADFTHPANRGAPRGKGHRILPD